MNVNLGLTLFKAVLPWLTFSIWCQIQRTVLGLKPWASRGGRKKRKPELIRSSCGPHFLLSQCNIHVRRVYFHDKWMRNKNNPPLTKQPLRWRRVLTTPGASRRSPVACRRLVAVFYLGYVLTWSRSASPERRYTLLIKHSVSHVLSHSWRTKLN